MAALVNLGVISLELTFNSIKDRKPGETILGVSLDREVLGAEG